MNTLPFTPDRPWLAPLAGYSDLPFRMLVRDFGCAAACTEMISVKGLCYKNSGTKRLLDTCPEDSPLVVQLFGSEPEFYVRAMDQLLERGFTHFDLNAGCPVRKVIKTGSGAALLKSPKKLLEIAKIMSDAAGPGRAGVKIRPGFDMGEDIYLDLARELEAQGSAWITLHPRYGKQIFLGDSDWSKLTLLKQSISIPVIASGDLITAEAAKSCIEQTGVDNIMFARGALFDPSIFARYHALSSGDIIPDDGTWLANIVCKHIRLTREYDGSDRSFRKIRSIIPRYAKGLNKIKELRQRLIGCNTWDALEVEARRIALLKRAK